MKLYICIFILYLYFYTVENAIKIVLLDVTLLSGHTKQKYYIICILIVYHINILPNVDKYVVRKYHKSDVDIRNENIT